jgi:hypothetical protein
MLPIKKDTILKAGDIISEPNGAEKWQITGIESGKFIVKNVNSGKEGYVIKNDLVSTKWLFEVKDGRKYW